MLEPNVDLVDLSSRRLSKRQGSEPWTAWDVVESLLTSLLFILPLGFAVLATFVWKSGLEGIAWGVVFLIASGFASMSTPLWFDRRASARCTIVDPKRQVILYPNGHCVHFGQTLTPWVQEDTEWYWATTSDNQLDLRSARIPRLYVSPSAPPLEVRSSTDEGLIDAKKTIVECQEAARRAKERAPQHEDSSRLSVAPSRFGGPTISSSIHPSRFSDEELADLMRVRHFWVPLSWHRLTLLFVPQILLLVYAFNFGAESGSVVGDPISSYALEYVMLFVFAVVPLAVSAYRFVRFGRITIRPKDEVIIVPDESYFERKHEIPIVWIEDPFVRTIDFGGPDSIDGNPKPAVYHFLVLNDEAHVVLEIPGRTPEQLEEIGRLLLKIQAANEYDQKPYRPSPPPPPARSPSRPTPPSTLSRSPTVLGSGLTEQSR